MTSQTIIPDAARRPFVDPAEAKLFRQLDEMHFPDPLAPTDAAMREGLPSVTVEGAQELWRLSRHAIENDQVRAIIESCDSWQIPFVLKAISAGRQFLADLGSYDRRYVRRADNGTLLAPSWTDDPTQIIESLRDLMRQPDSAAPAAPRLAA